MYHAHHLLILGTAYYFVWSTVNVNACKC